ncbi:MAG: hypothetical protein ACK5MN_04685 [Lachnospiraceae bacterium]
MTAVYCLYNPNSGKHLYTMDIRKRDCLPVIGWKYEGLAWYPAGA